MKKIVLFGVNLNEMDDEQFAEFADGFFDEDNNPAPTTKTEFKKWAEEQPFDPFIFREGWKEYMEEYL